MPLSATDFKPVSIQGEVNITLFCAKTRVKPLKVKRTLTGLELNGVLLLAELLKMLSIMMQLKVSKGQW